MAVYNNRMYFGTRGYMSWVRACDISPDFSKVGWSNQTQFLNGGAAVRSSTASHKEYTMSWTNISRDEARLIHDYADGVYDTRDGVNPIYFLDPFTMDKNVLPQLWATPAQSLFGGVSLVPGQTPTPTIYSNDGYNYPARGASYVANSSSAALWIPVPAGYTAWVGARGTASAGAGVRVTPTVGSSTAAPTTLTLIGENSPVRVNASFAGTAYDGIQLSLLNAGPASTAVLSLHAMTVQILPDGTVPGTGSFISGQGNSGCQFGDKPAQSPRAVKLDTVALSAKLIETGSWL